jgi:hypothetical protein
MLVFVAIDVLLSSSGNKRATSRLEDKGKTNVQAARDNKGDSQRRSHSKLDKKGADDNKLAKREKEEGPVQPTDPELKTRYLSDMQEFDVEVAEGRFAKKGKLGYSAGGSDSILVNGKTSPNGLSMCANSITGASAKYRLGREARTFLATAALNDSAGAAGAPPGLGRIPTPLTFLVLGNGKVLWKSKPVATARDVRECKVDVTGVDVLELRIACPGSGVNAQAVWVEPRVLLK